MAKKSSQMERVSLLLDQIEPMRAEIKKRCLSYLKRVLKNAENHSLDFYDEEKGENVGGKYVCVTYDGGGHPEYASNAFSNVNSIHLDKNHAGKDTIYLDTDDADDYEIENITWDELVSLADYVYRVYMPSVNKG